MADNIKISELTELTSGSLSDATIFPVVDGGSTKKASLSSLQSYLTDDLATDAEVSAQISTVNSTINTLTTDDISEGSNQYFTNARVDARIEDLGAITSSAGVDLTQTTNYSSGIKTRLDVEGVISSSNQISESAALAGFGSGGGGGSVPSGTVSSSAQTIKNLGGTGIISGSLTSDDITDFDSAVSSSAAAAGFGEGGGGGGLGTTDYVSNVSFSGTTLTFTGQGNAFNNTVDLSGGDLIQSSDLFGYLVTSVYQTDSASFASRITAGGGGGGGVPDGTISSSAQIYASFSGSNLVSSSQQIDGAQIDLSSLTTDDVSEGVTNRYYANSLVLPYLNQLQVVSGSSGGGFDVAGTNIVSSSTQIENLGFITNATYGAGTASLQSQIDTLDNQLDSSVLTDSVNDFVVTQKFRDIEVTGSVNITGIFSGSGAYLFDIPGTAIVGGIALSGSTIEDGAVSVVANSVSGITMTSTATGVNINGDVRVASGSLISGSGAGLHSIPGSAIVGGVGGGTQISSGSITASIDPNIGLIVNSDISASGEITAQSISVGTSGTPTIYSNNNLNLSASNAVVITDSPLRLNPFAAADTASFTLAEGDMVFSSDQNDFFGYRIVNSTGSWYSLTEGNVTEIEWSTIIGAPVGLISSSAQIVPTGSLISSSAQFLPSGAIAGTIYFEDTLNNMSGSSDFTYTSANRTLNVNKVIANELVYNTSLTGAGNDTGSYGRVETDTLNINSAIEFPTSDGTPNQVLKTDGNGNLDFASFADVLGNDNITTNGTATFGTGSINTDLTVGGTLNLGTPVHSTFNNQTTTIDSAFVNVLSSGSLILSSSVNVTIQDVLVLPEVTVKPTNPQSGSIITSGSGVTVKPYFWDGANWKALY